MNFFQRWLIMVIYILVQTEMAVKAELIFMFQNLLMENMHQPVNLGDSINTPDNEYEPFIAPDESYLIFMVTYPNGIAHADFYISYNKNGVWSKAEKLPEPINSYATEWGGKVTRDGKYFFFGSSRNKITDTLPQRENMQQYEKRLHSVRAMDWVIFIMWR